MISVKNPRISSSTKLLCVLTSFRQVKKVSSNIFNVTRAKILKRGTKVWDNKGRTETALPC